jgi:hypothetical protein
MSIIVDIMLVITLRIPKNCIEYILKYCEIYTNMIARRDSLSAMLVPCLSTESVEPVSDSSFQHRSCLSI